MARSPFQKPYKSSGGKPKASTPARPKGAKAMGGTAAGAMKAKPTANVKSPSVRVTSKASNKKSMNVGASLGGKPMQQAGKTGVANPGQWEGPKTPKS